MTPLHEILARAAEVEAKATPGPWEYRKGGSWSHCVPEVWVPLRHFPEAKHLIEQADKQMGCDCFFESDAAFIALSRTLLAPLIAVARAALAESEREIRDGQYDQTDEQFEVCKALEALAAVGSGA